MSLIQTFSSPAPLLPSRRRAASPSPSPSPPSFLPVLRLSSSYSSFPSFPYPFSNPSQYPKPPFLRNPPPEEEEEEGDDVIIGDCLVFEEGAFEQPVASKTNTFKHSNDKRKKKPGLSEPQPQNLVPDKWKEAVEEINLTKKEKRKIAYDLKFGSRVERRKPMPLPDIEHYR